MKRVRPSTWVIVLLLVMSASEAFRQHSESREITALAERIVSDAHATDRRSEVKALRDYIRVHVTRKGAPYTDAERPFLRATALETMQSGLGFCGEDARAFIVMADAIGVAAARVNLYGQNSHVVAVTDLGDGRAVVVDAFEDPVVRDFEPLDHVMVSYDYVDYSTLNVRRLHLSWLFSRIKLTMGPITFWGENPHAMKALFWAWLAVALFILTRIRGVVRALLLRRGWVHRTSLAAESARSSG